ncbi:hypothetical protein [Azospirillum doebereinerae]|uniref:Uncharacterized protein n=1 Tax=Azospirillum doebereinerae TaxID=92933 RepID=A0A3S0V415_9PROT|nr:hypothetical protein [Azospirillum doebereinerae]MCG5243028.1 hypothetical protein [Azospirillum doebereinerae]RUQ65879.1 hypothetical protein EJ913_24715 [Azospirillum doebereinerae]
MTADTPEKPDPAAQNQGEGNRTADAQYRRGVEDHVRNHDVQGDADRARKAVDGPEGEELRRAEEEGKRHAKGEDPQLKR